MRSIFQSHQWTSVIRHESAGEFFAKTGTAWHGILVMWMSEDGILRHQYHNHISQVQ
jgi:hypothetical protein